MNLKIVLRVISTMISDDWRENIMARIKQLQADKLRIEELDARLSYQQLISPRDKEAFRSVLRSVEREIEEIKFELYLDELLASDLSLEEFMKKFGWQ